MDSSSPSSSSSSSSSMKIDLTPPWLHQEVKGATQEFKDFLSSLPSEMYVGITQFYHYQGFWFSAPILQGMVNSQAQFKAQPTDIFLATIPKSGTTWLKALTFATVNRVHYHPAGPTYDQHHPLLVKNPHELVPVLEIMYRENQFPEDTDSPGNKVFSSHVPYTMLPESVTSSNCKIVYLCREPKDTIISLWHFFENIKPTDLEPIPLEDMFEKFCEGVSLYGPFWDHMLGYWKESLVNPERVCFLKYEDLKREPKVQLKVLAEFLGCPFTLEEENEGVLEGIIRLCSFEHLSNLDVNKTGVLPLAGVANKGFFRRGEVGDGMNHLTPKMIERLDQITKEKLGGSGLTF